MNSTPPGFSVSHESVDGTLNKKQDATLSDEDNHYMAGFRYELPAPGSLIASAKPVNPQAQISVSIYSEGSGGEPIAKGEPGKKVEATELQPGTYYVTVQEPWKEAIRTRVELRTIYKPQDPDAAQQACKTQATARDLNPDKGQAEETRVVCAVVAQGKPAPITLQELEATTRATFRIKDSLRTGQQVKVMSDE